jgi:hypothetical protein
MCCVYLCMHTQRRHTISWAQWYTSIVQVHERPRHEDYLSLRAWHWLGNIVRWDKREGKGKKERVKRINIRVQRLLNISVLNKPIMQAALRNWLSLLSAYSSSRVFALSRGFSTSTKITQFYKSTAIFYIQRNQIIGIQRKTMILAWKLKNIQQIAKEVSLVKGLFKWAHFQFFLWFPNMCWLMFMRD